jgi:lysophospholipase L1-like esterase
MNGIIFIKRSFVLSLCIAVTAMLTSCSTSQRTYQIRESNYTRPIRVACVGDSITYGFGIKDREHDSYPAQLGVLLGSKWEVRNFGVNGATALRRGTRPYHSQKAFEDALAYEPDVVVIKLGTNDTNAKSWPDHKEEFISDYLQIISSFEDLETKPHIYLCRPVPLFRDRGKDYDTDKILTEEVIPKINAVARKQHLPVIDLYVAMDDKGALFPDGVHPDAEGARIMAQKIQHALTGSSENNLTDVTDKAANMTHAGGSHKK